MPASSCDESASGKRKYATEEPAPFEQDVKRRKDGEGGMQELPTSSSASSLYDDKDHFDLGPRLCVSCWSDLFCRKKAFEITQPSECITCKLSKSASLCNDVGTSEDNMKRVVRVSSRSYSNTHSSVALEALWVFRPCGELVIGPKCVDSSATIGKVVDPNTIASWLEHCETVHGAKCLRHDSPPRLAKPIEVLVVDVSRHCLTKKTTAVKYFTLSYVWGKAVMDTTKTTTQNLAGRMEAGSLENIPSLSKTVTDAIKLTREMGVRYLWVDCLSIVQDSPKKHQAIHDMDIIYSQAALTIVAVDGKDADSGLAGVRAGTRRERVTTVTQRSYTATLRLPTNKLELLTGSTYNSRGWTFQELLLSKRLLFITEQQASFHCDTSLRSEAINHENFNDSGLFMRSITMRSNEAGPRSKKLILESYAAMVEEYTSRSLSYDTDVENAFSGLASVLVQWCGGSPVVHGMASSFFGYSMHWNFGSRGGCRKRAAFPSWSWVGWTGAGLNTISGHRGGDITHHLPLRSLIGNVIITSYGIRDDPVACSVVDRSAVESDAPSDSEGQRIQIDLKPAADLGSLSPVSSTLDFEAERTDWTNYSIRHSSTSGSDNILILTSRQSPCGAVSLAPVRTIMREVYNQMSTHQHQPLKAWSLVRTYRLHSMPWDGGEIGGCLKSALRDLEYADDDGDESSDEESDRHFLQRLRLRSLVSVLVVRRCGENSWERIGSGIMLEEGWPSTSEGEEVRAYREHVVLV